MGLSGFGSKGKNNISIPEWLNKFQQQKSETYDS